MTTVHISDPRSNETADEYLARVQRENRTEHGASYPSMTVQYEATYRIIEREIAAVYDLEDVKVILMRMAVLLRTIQGLN